MSGEYILKRMRIREYIHFKRRHINNKTRVNETSKRPSYVYQSKPVSNNPNPHSAYTKAINDLNELLENSNEVIRPVVALQPFLKHSISSLLDCNDRNSAYNDG